MSIYLFSGLPGSGKSLDATGCVVRDLRAGRCVVCNYDLRTDLLPNADLFHYHPNSELSPDLLRRYADEHWASHDFHEHGLTFVLDEAQVVHNARLWNAGGGRERLRWIEFYSQHRKYGYDVLMISQFDRMLDKQMRALIEYEYKHRAVSNMGTFGTLLQLLGLAGFMRVEYTYADKLRTGWKFIRASKRITRLYDSYGIFAALPERSRAEAGRGDPASRTAALCTE